MMNYFRDGGFNMWILLIGAVATFAVALTRPRAARPAIFATGAFFSLISGLFGISTGMVAVAKHYRNFPDPLLALGEGLRELSNNGTFAAMLALVQGIAALVAARAAASRE